MTVKIMPSRNDTQNVTVILRTDFEAQQLTVCLRAAIAALASMYVKDGVGLSDFLMGCLGSGTLMVVCGQRGRGLEGELRRGVTQRCTTREEFTRTRREEMTRTGILGKKGKVNRTRRVDYSWRVDESWDS